MRSGNGNWRGWLIVPIGRGRPNGSIILYFLGGFITGRFLRLWWGGLVGITGFCGIRYRWVCRWWMLLRRWWRCIRIMIMGITPKGRRGFGRARRLGRIIGCMRGNFGLWSMPLIYWDRTEGCGRITGDGLHRLEGNFTTLGFGGLRPRSLCAIGWDCGGGGRMRGEGS